MTRLPLLLFVAIAGLMAFFFVSSSAPRDDIPSSQAATSPIKIMPLGDSITDGYNIPGGYRIEMWKKFPERNWNIDFVGSLANGPVALGDPNHEGHSGWFIGQIATSVNGWLASTPADIILLMIGTNDIGQDVNRATAPDRLNSLVDQISSQAPNTTLLVASVPPINDPTKNQWIITFNNTIPGMVSSKQAQGKKVQFVDVYSGLTMADLADGVHPTQVGYNKIANAWLAKLQTIIPTSSASPGSTPRPSVTSAPTPLQGDADKNGKVDIFDYNLIIRDYNCGVTRVCTYPVDANGDVDKNDRIDIFDYNIILRDYGKTS